MLPTTTHLLYRYCRRIPMRTSPPRWSYKSTTRSVSGALGGGTLRFYRNDVDVGVEFGGLLSLPSLARAQPLRRRGLRLVALMSFASEPNFFWRHLKDQANAADPAYTCI